MNNNNSILNCFLASRNPIEQSNVFEWYKYWSNINRKLPFSHEVEHQQGQSNAVVAKDEKETKVAGRPILLNSDSGVVPKISNHRH